MPRGIVVVGVGVGVGVIIIIIIIIMIVAVTCIPVLGLVEFRKGRALMLVHPCQVRGVRERLDLDHQVPHVLITDPGLGRGHDAAGDAVLDAPVKIDGA